MTTHPVRFSVEPQYHRDRMQLLLRLAVILVIGSVTWSSLYWLVYLILPTAAAILVSQKGGPAYLAEDGPRIASALRWVGAAFAYLWLLTDAFPTDGVGGTVELEIDTNGPPTPGAALVRLLTSLPAMLVALCLTCAAAPLWIVGAVAIVLNERLPPWIATLLEQMLRYRLRAIAYHVSLVREYAAFDLSHTAPLPPSGAT